MKNILSFIFILYSIHSFGQNINNLDQKYGFKKFKFGSTPDQIKNLSKEQNQFSKNPYVTSYKYIGTDITSIFNVDIKEISLDFFKNKLFNISISFGSINNDYTEKQYNNVQYSLEQTYGKEWKTTTNETGVYLNSAIWIGKLVTLEHHRTDFTRDKYDPKNYGFISGYIAIFENKMNHEMFQSEF